LRRNGRCEHARACAAQRARNACAASEPLHGDGLGAWRWVVAQRQRDFLAGPGRLGTGRVSGTAFPGERVGGRLPTHPPPGPTL
jgi:hypothetical protein